MTEEHLVESAVRPHLEHLDQVFAQTGFRYVELMAPSGSGKSTVVREFYRRLASEQSAPKYWPLELHPASGDPLVRRKVLGPPQTSFRSDPGALPGYLWLTVCPEERSDGAPAKSIHQLVRQLQLHDEALLVEALQRAGLLRLDAARDLLRALGRASAEEIRDRAYDLFLEAVGVAVPGAKAATAVALRMRDRYRSARSARRTVGEGAERVVPAGSAGAEVRDRIADVAASEIRVVIAVEDAHALDDSMADAIASWATLGTDVMVVGTCWPEGADRPVYRRMVRRIAQAPGACYSTRPFSPWDADQLRELVLAEYPRTASEVVNRLTARFTTPLTLSMALRLHSVRDSAHNEAICLDAEDVADMPIDDVAVIYAQRWQELSDHAKTALLLAMAITGSQGFDDGHRFIEDVVERVGNDSGIELLDGLAAGTEDWWIAEILEGVTGYREPLLAQVVSGRVRNFYTRSKLRDLRELAYIALTEKMASVDVTGPVTEAEGLLARWWRTLASADSEAQPELLAKAAIVEGRRLLELHDPHSCLDLLRDAPGVVPAEDEEQISWWQLTYDATSRSGNFQEAIDAGEQLIHLLADDPVRCVVLRIEGAYWRRLLGRTAEASALLHQLVREVADDEGIPWRVRSRAMADHAAAVGHLGDPSQAEAMLTDLMRASAERVERDAPVTLDIERQRWRWAGAGGRLRTACDGLSNLLDRMQQVLGEDDPSTLFTMSNLSYFLVRAGELSEGERLADEVLQRRTRVLGPVHPHTIDTARNIARIRAITQGPRGAVNEYAEVLHLVLAAGGPKTPLMLSTQLDYAIALAQSGEVEDVAAVLTAIADAIGPEPSRATLMATIGEYGDLPALRQKLETLRAEIPDDLSTEIVAAINAWLRVVGSHASLR